MEGVEMKLKSIPLLLLLAAQLGYLLRRFPPLSPSSQQGIDGIVVQQPTLPVQAYQFAAGPESGI